MAWGARSGLKLLAVKLLSKLVCRLNGQGSPFGIETGARSRCDADRTMAKWPGEPVRG